MKLDKKNIFTICLILYFLVFPAYAQITPPAPPAKEERAIKPAEGTMLHGKEGTGSFKSSLSGKKNTGSSRPSHGKASRPALMPRILKPGAGKRVKKTGVEHPRTEEKRIIRTQQVSQGPSPSREDRMVTLDFNNVDLVTFIRFISELTGKNFVIDEKVQGKVTVISPSKISVDEAYKVFLTVLDLKGYTAVAEGKVIKIFPAREAKQSNVKVLEDRKKSPSEDNYETRVLRLKYIDVAELSKLIAPLISRNGSAIPYRETNTLILTDLSSNMKKLLSLIEELDREPPREKGGIYVYYLQNADAEEMAKVLTTLTSRVPRRITSRGPKKEPVHFEGGISITADKATNSLIIMASPEDYERIKAIIRKLDIKRKQVYVEAAIVEMSLDKTREIGIEWRTTTGIHPDKYSFAGGTLLAPPGAGLSTFAQNFPEGALSVSGLVIGGIKGFMPDGTTLNVGALLRAFQADSDINILSTPNILTLDNQEAKIVVGQNVPFITGVSQTAGGNVQATVERKDVGIQLKITPHITESDQVKLDIYQEISSLSGSIPVGTNQEVPITNKRSAETTVVVKNNETIVIGGLIKDDVKIIERKVPFFGDLPLLGYLFKYQKKQKVKTNLLIFLTPHIIKDYKALSEITAEKRRKAEEFRRKYKFELKGDFLLNPVSP